ncbi:MAG: codB 1 [Rhodospirillales bacterium]|nr:codB 1 [Rhodospirillales bacterium]
MMRTDATGREGDDARIVADAPGASPALAGGDEFTLSAVPSAATTAAYKIGILLLAANISLPALIMGGELGIGLGFRATAMACLWGGLILAALAGLCAYAGARSRMTTYVLIIRAFGRRGGEFINLLLSLSAIGWFGVVVMLFAHTIVRMVHAATPIGSASLWAVAGSVLMAITTIKGFRALNLLSNFMLPLKTGLLIWALAAAIETYGMGFSGPVTGPVTLDSRTAISFVVGGWVVGAVVAPDFARYARSRIGGAFACAFALGVGYPLVLLASSVPAILTGEKDMLATMETLGMGLSALAIVLLASWTNGASNLYSGSLMLATVFRRRSRATLVWSAGALGLLLGLLGVTDVIIPYLVVLSAVVPPIAGVYLPRFFIDQRAGAAQLTERNWRPEALVALASGVAAAAIGDQSGYALTGIVAIDSLLVSATVYVGFELLRGRRTKHNEARL